MSGSDRNPPRRKVGGRSVYPAQLAGVVVKALGQAIEALGKFFIGNVALVVKDLPGLTDRHLCGHRPQPPTQAAQIFHAIARLIGYSGEKSTLPWVEVNLVKPTLDSLRRVGDARSLLMQHGEGQADQPLVIGGETIPRGKRVRLDLPVARLTTGTMMSLPVTVISGKKPGPRLWLSAAIHGDELNGVDIIRRVARALKPHRLNGTVIAVPVVNIFGLLEQSRYLPDRRDLNRSFPGSARGSMASRLAHLFMKEVVSQCTHGIDLHTAAIHRINLPQVRADLQDPATYAFAQAFGAPVIIHASHRDGSLRQAAAKRKIPTLLYEAGEALRFDPQAIQTGVDGIYRVMAYLGMYAPPETTAPATVEARQTRWVRASRGGIWHRSIALGDEVKQRQPLGFISDTFGDKPVQVRSPMDGLVIGHGQNPLVNQGDALVHIASVRAEAEQEQ